MYIKKLWYLYLLPEAWICLRRPGKEHFLQAGGIRVGYTHLCNKHQPRNGLRLHQASFSSGGLDCIVRHQRNVSNIGVV